METTESARKAARPWWLNVVWAGLGAAIVVLLAHGLFGFGGEATHDFLENWVSDAAVWVTAFVCLAGAAHAERSRAAWFIVGAALVS